MNRHMWATEIRALPTRGATSSRTPDETEQILYADIDFNRIEEVREQLPIVRNRRPELY